MSGLVRMNSPTSGSRVKPCTPCPFTAKTSWQFALYLLHHSDTARRSWGGYLVKNGLKALIPEASHLRKKILEQFLSRRGTRNVSYFAKIGKQSWGKMELRGPPWSDGRLFCIQDFSELILSVASRSVRNQASRKVPQTKGRRDSSRAPREATFCAQIPTRGTP